MNIRGVIKFSLLEYPGRLACAIFVGGCNFACPYCHNPHLVLDPDSQPRINEESFFHFLESRRGKLDAVVISGGEPSLRNSIVDFALRVKARGFLVKIDTNGSNPDIIKKLHISGAVDFIGLDYKAPAKKYIDISKCKNRYISRNVQRSIKYIVDNKIDYEIRTTVHKELLSKGDLSDMRNELVLLGVKSWKLQQFVKNDIIDDRLNEFPSYTDKELCNFSIVCPPCR